MLALWLWTRSNLNESAPVYARTPASVPAPAVAVSTPSLETVPAAAPEVTPAMAVSEAAPATNVSSVSKPEIFQPAAEPTPAIASEATADKVPVPSLLPKESAQPDFRLSGIVYGVARPCAILNGKTVYVGDQVNGATVISITQTSVTLQINGLRKTYALH